ncbi:MAG: response regulator [Desulfobacterales bacterium]|nr:response regulator [Desulfobacterales bacterium]
MDEKDNLAKKCTDLEKQSEYYKDIAEKTGQRRLREVEQLNRFISECKKSAKALHESEHRFKLIAQSTNDIFYELDIESGELKWLGDIDSALGYEAGEIKHTLEDWLRLIHPKDRPSLDNAVLLHKKSTKSIDHSYRVIRKDGSIRWWNDNSSSVLDQEGKIKKWVGGISDISESKKAEEALIQAQRLSAIGELASGVAHDFNNSLQGIFGNIELALLENISPKMRDYLETIKQSTADAASRIGQLLRFSGKNKSRKDYEHLNPNRVVDDVISQTRPLWKDEAEKKGIAIAVEKNYAEKELRIEANAGELRSVLYNLVKNSIQAMPEGGSLTFETGKTEKSVYVTVSDTGLGMDEETKTRIFQPFFTTKSFKQGKGLGMSTSYAIVKEHSGEIYVKESVPGKGTSIEITLPHSKRKENRLEEAVSGYEGSANVLWVDDEEMIRVVGKKQLEQLQHRVDVAASGEEALNLLKNNKYDLMVTDIGMPNISGWQLAEKIKGNFPDMKVAVVTGWGSDISNEEKEKYGVGYVLGKPVSLERLKQMVAEVLQLKQK